MEVIINPRKLVSRNNFERYFVKGELNVHVSVIQYHDLAFRSFKGPFDFLEPRKIIYRAIFEVFTAYQKLVLYHRRNLRQQNGGVQYKRLGLTGLVLLEDH